MNLIFEYSKYTYKYLLHFKPVEEIIEMNNLIINNNALYNFAQGVDHIYKYKLLIENNNVKKNKVNDWRLLVIGKL